jgi:hypothetical protein
VGQFADRLGQHRVVRADLEAQGALTGARQHLVDAEQAAHAGREAEALQAGGGQHDGVVAAFVELAQAGVEIAAQRFDAQVRAQAQQLRDAAQTGTADDRALGQLGQ